MTLMIVSLRKNVNERCILRKASGTNSILHHWGFCYVIINDDNHHHHNGHHHHPHYNDLDNLSGKRWHTVTATGLLLKTKRPKRQKLLAWRGNLEVKTESCC